MDSDDGAFAMVAVYHRGGVWALRHAVPEGLRAAGHVIGCDIALRRGDVTTFRETVAAEIRSDHPERSDEHTSELQSLMRLSYAVFCLQNKRPISEYHQTRESPDGLGILNDAMIYSIVSPPNCNNCTL